jgi:cytokinin riboside 5'-monophosphate phosphoribohydrolase
MRTDQASEPGRCEDRAHDRRMTDLFYQRTERYHPMTIGVYCSASDAIAQHFKDAANEVGRLIAARRHKLVYGGGRVGLMGVVARAVHDHGGTVIGAIPTTLKQREGIAYEVADEMHVTETMQERKRIIFTRADAFIVLPGGFGTLEELMEVLTLRQLGYHDKPITILNTDGFYDRLLDLFEHFYLAKTAHERYRTLYQIASSPEEALRQIESTRAAA